MSTRFRSRRKEGDEVRLVSMERDGRDTARCRRGGVGVHLLTLARREVVQNRFRQCFGRIK